MTDPTDATGGQVVTPLTCSPFSSLTEVLMGWILHSDWNTYYFTTQNTFPDMNVMGFFSQYIHSVFTEYLYHLGMKIKKEQTVNEWPNLETDRSIT